MAVGIVCYLIAEALIPKQFGSPADHDIRLADRLGFIYTPIVGLWVGWLQRSWKRAITGAIVGALVGFLYMLLCASGNFMAIEVGFPCLLGAVLAVVLGSNRSDWLRDFGARLGKGLLAGLVFGFVYTVTLNIVGAMVSTPTFEVGLDTKSYVAMMWRAGPVALGISSSLFFILMRWAVGLTRVKLLVFEEPDDPPLSR
jgi:hypothetical protein